MWIYELQPPLTRTVICEAGLRVAAPQEATELEFHLQGEAASDLLHTLHSLDQNREDALEDDIKVVSVIE